MRSWVRRGGVLPGFGLSLGYTVLYLGLIVLLPLAALTGKAAGAGVSSLLEAASSPRVLASLRLSFGASALAALVNTVFGLPVAWALARYAFPGRRWVDALVDIPFALPTAVAGIALTAVCAPSGLLGRPLAALGWPVAFAPAGVVVALTFIGLPFVVRTLQPMFESMDPDMEEAALTLGATRGQVLARVVLPPVLPALLAGFTLAFARGLGEYGSVIFISGNIPFRTEIAPLLIMSRLEEHDVAGAAVLALLMLALSFAMLLVVNGLQALTRRRVGEA